MKYYKQVIVKSKDDLPEEKGRYIVNLKKTGTQRDYPFYGTSMSVRLWLKYVDWYLVPVEQSDLRDELIKMLKNETVQCTYGVESEEETVDRYLNDKENKL
jgi:hypothetical protein